MTEITQVPEIEYNEALGRVSHAISVGDINVAMAELEDLRRYTIRGLDPRYAQDARMALVYLQKELPEYKYRDKNCSPDNVFGHIIETANDGCIERLWEAGLILFHISTHCRKPSARRSLQEAVAGWPILKWMIQKFPSEIKEVMGRRRSFGYSITEQKMLEIVTVVILNILVTRGFWEGPTMGELPG